MTFTCRMRIGLGDAGERDSQSKREETVQGYKLHGLTPPELQGAHLFHFHEHRARFRNTQRIYETVQLQLPQAPAQRRI